MATLSVRRSLITFAAAIALWGVIPSIWMYCRLGGRFHEDLTSEDAAGITAGWSTAHPTEVGWGISAAQPTAAIAHTLDGLFVVYLPLADADGSGFRPASIHNPFVNIQSWQYKNGNRAFIVEIPIWATTLILLPLPIAAFAGYRTTRRIEARRRESLCRRCGYDLRSSGRVCPECGDADEFRIAA